MWVRALDGQFPNMVKRKINPELEAYLDRKLASFGASHDAIRKKDARLVMQYAALSLVGLRESGTNRGREVLWMSDTIGPPDAIPWCMALVQSCIAYAEEKTGILSPVKATEHVMTCWRDTPKEYRVRFFPLPGAIVIWNHIGSDRGHTGILLETEAMDFLTVEGNTSAGIDTRDEVVREGDGVYKVRRKFGKIGNMQLMGFIRPFDPPPTLAPI